MSSFVVNVSCIDDVVTLLCEKTAKYKDEDRTALGKRLMQMNVDAVNYLYGFSYTMNKDYVYTKSERNELTLYSNFCCFICQCSEGEIKRSEEYKELCFYKKVFINYLYQKYVSNDSKTYEHIKGIDLVHFMQDKILDYMDKNNIERAWGK
jgi:hypothetical protein